MIQSSSLRWRAAFVAASCASALLWAAPAAAQEGNTQIGPPQLRDFQLEPRQRIVTQPRPAPATTPPATTPAPTERPTTRLTPAPAPQATTRTNPAARPTAPTAPTAQPNQPRPSAAPQPTRAAPPAGTRAAPTDLLETPAPAPALTPEAAAPPAAEPVVLPDPVAPAAPAGSDLPDGPPAWLYFLAFATLGLLGYGFWLRRRTVERRAVAGPAPVLAPPTPAEPRAPRPAPQPRPWLELEIAAERATIDLEQSVVEFELAVHNSGGTEARNVRIQARMFSSSPDQDKQINAYFKGDESAYRTIALPPIPAGEDIRIKGSVDMPRDRISALKVEDKLLLIPLVAVIARYEWGASRFGQTARSWVIGREQAGAGEKMAPFRIDPAAGARVHRTVGHRPHTVSRRI